MIYSAIVTEVHPAVPGIRVRFKDLAPSGFAQYDFVRVLMPRMSPVGGAAAWLPEVDELGIVGELEGGYLVWLGSLGFLDGNQVDPTPDIAYMKHQSGVVVQMRKNGDTEIRHPSGVRITFSGDGSSLPDLEASSAPPAKDTVVPTLRIAHPSGSYFELGPSGRAAVKAPLFTLHGNIKNSGVTDTDASASGSFTTPTGDVVTIQNGVVTSVAPVGTVGNATLNIEYFDALIESLDAVQSCPDLSVIAGDAAASLQELKASILAQQAKVQAWSGLLAAPGSPSAVITWIYSFITAYLQPQFAPTITYAAQLTALATKITDVVNAINNAKARIPGCTYTPPSI